MSEKRFFENFEEYHEYNLSGAKKLIIENRLLINPIRDYVQQTLVLLYVIILFIFFQILKF